MLWSSGSGDFEKSMSDDELEDETNDSYFESRLFAEENLSNDKWEFQAETHHDCVQKIYRKFIKIYVNEFVFSYICINHTSLSK